MLKVVHCSHLADNVRIPASKRGLRWPDVDLKAGELHVRQRADCFGVIGAPKTNSSRRAVPLGPDLSLTLKNWKLQCPKGELDLAVPLGPDLSLTLKNWKLQCPKGELDLVFPTATGAIDSHANILRSLVAIMKAAGIVTKSGTPKYTLHSFRHFFASWCINPRDRGGRELPPKVVQQLLGHSSIMMTLDIYGDLFRDETDKKELAASERVLLG